MSERWSAIFCVTGAWGSKSIGRALILAILHPNKFYQKNFLKTLESRLKFLSKKILWASSDFQLHCLWDISSDLYLFRGIPGHGFKHRVTKEFWTPFSSHWYNFFSLNSIPLGACFETHSYLSKDLLQLFLIWP